MPLRHPVKYVYIGHREEGDKGAVRLLRTSGSPRATSSRWKGATWSRNAQNLSLRGGQNGRRGNPSCHGGRRSTCLCAPRFPVDRQGLSALAMTRVLDILGAVPWQ